MSFSLTDSERIQLNADLQSYLRRAAARRPNSQRSGPFLARFDDDDVNPYSNYAIPDDGADPDGAAIAALIALFEARRRKPRLEYVAEAAPRLEAALIARGFSVEARVPVMVCLPGMQTGGPEISGLHIFVASGDDDLTGAEAAQAEAFGGEARGPRGMRRLIRHGGIVVAARDTASGAIVGSGTVMVPVDGISEVTSIGVRSAFRRRGAAGTITALLARQAFAAGMKLLWLTPGGHDAERIYARAGFHVASEALHISL